MSTVTIASGIDIVAPQTEAQEPEAFQARIIAAMTAALLREAAVPCLLRAPTGSGKTFMLGRVLSAVSQRAPTVWFWFVPFVTLVQQTENVITSTAPCLSPVMLARGRNQDAATGLVLISTAQAVARAQWRNSGYSADADDQVRSLAETVARARAQGLSIGMVVDEAHIALDRQTEFGRFAHWLKPERLVMATATPRDQRLNAFLDAAGYATLEQFSASRDDVVSARLNKRYVEAVVYDLRQSMQTVTDLQRTVLRQAWKRHLRLKRQLVEHQVATVPLMLVQVANGAQTVEQAERDLMQLCKVPAHCIGKHSADDPDPVLMAAIANDTTKEVLIFKQSAGTGFDAPRAFVLASTKAVSDPDFALQFVGRIMRVAAATRRRFPRPQPVPVELDTAYIYLADAHAQTGFAQAVKSTAEVQSQLEGQLEKLVAARTVSGATVLTNRPTEQFPLPMAMSPHAPMQVPVQDAANAPAAAEEPAQQTLFTAEDAAVGSTAATNDTPLDEVLRPPLPLPAAAVVPATREGMLLALQDHGLRSYALREDLCIPRCLWRETRPEMSNMSGISRAVATQLPIASELTQLAVRAALDRIREREIHTELTTLARREEEVQVITDRQALAREAWGMLSDLPQVEDEDARIIVEVLTQRLRPAVDEQFESLDADERPDERALQLFARNAAFWVVRKSVDALAEGLQARISDAAVLALAEPLPDVMLFPVDLPLETSRKNIYGVFGPSEMDLVQVEQVLLLDSRQRLADKAYALSAGEEMRTGRFDHGAVLNGEERQFAKALDRAEFVLWWHRNPDRKGYAVRVVRGDHQHYFHPDFVVCLSHIPGDTALMRLIETKENVKDAARKMRHVPKFYGPVMFLTKDRSALRWVKADGSLGDSVDFDGLDALREWMRQSAPVQETGA